LSRILEILRWAKFRSVRRPQPAIMTHVVRNAVGVIEERASTCSCELERARTVDAELELLPELGRHEWRGWTRALSELLGGLADGPVHVLILTQPVSERYVQLVVGHGTARVEASSNAHLRGDRLSAHDERRLASLGYRRPDAASPYWALEEAVGLPEQLAELVAHTLVGIFGFDATSPLAVGRFGADRPCRSCTWAA
jgi:T3SS (YopN, CesT) and YbjN peptide-binding chaperone 3